MFYAHFVLSKKGPLAKIWLAAHWDKKLTKAHVFETNIESSVEGILQPKVKMALRTSGHLLLGIVRIYSRKAKYLLADCNEAFIKIKMAFRPGIVDLPEGNREAAVATITLPEVFHDFDTAMPDITIDMDAQVTLNQSRAEDITLKEDYGTLTLMGDDGFEDLAFEADTARDGTSMEEGFDHASLLLGDEQSKDQPEENIQNANTSNASVSKPNVSLDQPLRDDGFGGTVGEGLLDGESGGLFEPAGLFDDAPLGDVPLENNVAEPPEEGVAEDLTHTQIDKPAVEHDDASDDDMYDMGPASMGAPSPPSSPETPLPPATEIDVPLDLGNTVNGIDGPPTSVATSDTAADILLPVGLPPPSSLPPLENTTLIHNEDESFALAPLDTTIIQGPERTVKAKRKRKLIVDEVKNISGEEMKSQLSDTTDIVTTLDLAPPTKRLMLWKETGGVEKLFALPGHRILSRTLSRAYQRHLTSRSVENEDFGIEEDNIDLDADLEQAREDPDASGLVPRKRQRRENIDQVFPQDLQMDSLHLDASRPSYASDHSLSHPSLDVPSFLQPPHHLFSPSQQIMGNMLQHPPPAHMIQQMLHHDVNHLAHLPDMMHSSIVDQGPSLHSINPSIHSVPSPAVSDTFNQRLVHPVIDSMSDHMLSDALPDHMQHSSINKQMSGHSPANQMNQQTLQDQLSHSDDHLTSIENNLHHCTEDEIQSHMDGQLLHPPVDDDVTQTFGADYAQSLIADSNALSATMAVLSNNDQNLPIVSDHLNESPTQNCVVHNDINQQTVDQQSESTTLFDSINGPVSAEINLQNQNNQISESNVLQKANEFAISDDEDDYGAPGSVGPALPEEQMADETYEQFEERILTKRTTHMLHIINNKLEEEKSVNFASVVRNNKRKQVAQKFYTFLVLKKQQAVELEQNSSYGDLIITKGPKFNAVYSSN